MKKSGLIGVIVLVIIGVIVLVMASAGFYFYKYHIFETLRVCIGDDHNTTYSCKTADDCFNVTGNFNVIKELEGAPSFVQETFEKTLNEAIYCDGVCFVREVRGINIEKQELEMLEICYENETEITVNIRGKEALEAYNWARNLKNNK